MYFPLVLFIPLAAFAQPLSLRIIYDSTSFSPEYQADWGLSVLVEFRGQRVLFDAGARPAVFSSNLSKFGIQTGSIGKFVLSHAHRDHSGGLFLPQAMKLSAPLYLLDGFPKRLIDTAASAGYAPVVGRGPQQVFPGIYTTGLVGDATPEQSLVIETSKGRVLVTGCSHPGVTQIVETAQKQRNAARVRLVIGGFHMLADDQARVEATVNRLKELKVTSVAPAHCTGDLATRILRDEFRKDFVLAGAGRTIELQ
jgi:7,8-dihydropterin-6-yl-methyl-4-(beta-D-ribofuranosyl)aminobenzene 5'-phosphate synthase